MSLGDLLCVGEAKNKVDDAGRTSACAACAPPSPSATSWHSISADLCRIRPLPAPPSMSRHRKPTGSRTGARRQKKITAYSRARGDRIDTHTHTLSVPRRSGTLIIDTCSTRCPICSCDRYRAKGNAPNSPRLADIRRIPTDYLDLRKKRKLKRGEKGY